MNGITILHGDVREVLPTLPDESVHCVVTSPPYWGLRDYGVEGQLGLERTPEEYVSNMVGVFREVRRILRDDGTLWLNMGDSYATGAGKVGDCPGGGEQGERWKGNRGQHTAENSGKHGPSLEAMGPRIQPNRMPIPGLKPKDLCGIPWMLAFALRADGWYLRQDIIWSKPNPMPESVTDRCTKAHEYLFLLSKRERYYFDQDAILEACSPATHARLSQDVQAQIGSARVPGKTNGNMKAVGRKLAEPGSGTKNNSSFDAAMAIMPEKRNKRSVWEVTTQPFPEAHFATFPEDLIKPCILAGCPAGGTVLDPFFGSGTTGLVASKLHCKCIGVELNAEYIKIAEKRLGQDVLHFAEVV
jgi:DNA modification methylase